MSLTVHSVASERRRIIIEVWVLLNKSPFENLRSGLDRKRRDCERESTLRSSTLPAACARIANLLHDISIITHTLIDMVQSVKDTKRRREFATVRCTRVHPMLVL